MTLDLRPVSDGQSISRRPLGRVARLYVSIVGTIQARIMLARVLKPYRTRGSPDIPAHLLRDIGLPADFRSEGRKYWDHQ